MWLPHLLKPVEVLLVADLAKGESASDSQGSSSRGLLHYTRGGLGPHILKGKRDTELVRKLVTETPQEVVCKPFQTVKLGLHPS